MFVLTFLEWQMDGEFTTLEFWVKFELQMAVLFSSRKQTKAKNLN